MEENREELKRSRVNSSQGAHSAGTYPGSYNMKRLGAVLLPLAFHQAFLTIRRYPFILLGKEIRCESKKYSSQEYKTMTQPGFESLTTRPPRSHFPHISCSFQEHGI